MKTAILGIALLAGLSAMAQTGQTVLEDFKPSSLNQPSQPYPQVNSQGYARFRIDAPDAQSVIVTGGWVEAGTSRSKKAMTARGWAPSSGRWMKASTITISP